MNLQSVIDNGRRIVFFGGAGVSTESGIPDFRSESGLYKARTEFGRSPEEMISHSFFLREPEVFYRYYKGYMIFPDAPPNAAHLGLAKLEKAGRLRSVVTQNIDGLHQRAGSDAVRELHGSVMRNYCMECGKRFDLAYVLDEANCSDRLGHGREGRGHIPICDACGGMVRPDVVLYEESLDDETVRRAVKDISEADVLIVGGTSLVVYPAAGFLNYFSGDTLVLINKGETSYDSRADLVIREPIGEVFAGLRI
jgi:NAD-dependent deacetylase